MTEKRFILRYQEQDGTSRTVALEGTEWTLGRAPENRIRLSEPTVSRHHALLRRQGNTFFLRELQPRNPILDENLRPLFHEAEEDGPTVKEMELTPGKPFLLGTTWVWVESAEENAENPSTQQNEPYQVPSLNGLKELQEWAGSLAEPRDNESRADGALRCLARILSYQRGLVGLFEEGNRLRSLAYLQPQGRGNPTKPKMVVSDTVAMKVRNSRKPLLVTNTLEDATLQDRESVIALGIRSVMAIPLAWDDEVKGLLYLDRGKRSKPFTQNDLHASTLVAHVLALSLKIHEMESGAVLWAARTEMAPALSQAGAHTPVATDPDLEVVGSSKVFQDHLALLRDVADHDASVLVWGETGSGKETAARLIHSWSSRAGKPFVSLKCGALRDSLLEMELFGYSPKPGTSRGGLHPKKGRIQLAQEGTLFLDEIGDLSPSAQEKLLQVLETGEIQPLGSDEKIPVDFRLIAATGRDLESLVEAGEFRKDLYDRISSFVVRVPTLRERGEDILALAKAFLAKKAKSLSISPPRISPAAAGLLSAYSWPGNVRELKHVMGQALILGARKLVTPEELPPELRRASPTVPIVRLPLSTVERVHIQKVLAFCKGNVRMAARVLGIATSTLYEKIKRYGLEGEVSRRRRVRRELAKKGGDLDSMEFFNEEEADLEDGEEEDEDEDEKIVEGKKPSK